MAKHRVSIYIDEELWAEIDKRKWTERKSMNQIIEDILYKAFSRTVLKRPAAKASAVIGYPKSKQVGKKS